MKVLGLALSLIAAQDSARLGALPSEDEPFTVALSLKFRSEGKDAAPLQYECSFRIAYAVKKTDGLTRLEGRFIQFSFSGDLGDGKLDIRWDDTKKIESVDWGSAKALREMVAGGLRIELDAAGNVVRGGSDAARHLVMTLEPLLVGSASQLPGTARKVGDRWTGIFESADSAAEVASRYEKAENGAALIASTITLKDRKQKETPAATGTATTRIDLKTGRPTGSAVKLELSGPSQSVTFEGSVSVTPTERP